MEHKELKGKLVSFTTKDGLSLQGFISESKLKNKKAIMHIHGMTGNFFSLPLGWELAKELRGSDYDLFTTNTRGFGVKTRFYIGKKKRTIGTAFEKFEECILDIDAAIKAAQNLGYDEVILSGHSTGCQKIIYYQGKKNNPIVKALILLGPGSDYELAKKMLGKKFNLAVNLAKSLVKKGKGNLPPGNYAGDYSAKRFLSYAIPTNPEGELFNYGGKLRHFSKVKQPMIVIFGSKDHTTADKPKNELAKLRKKTKSELFITVEVKNADHGFRGKEKETAKAIVDFLKMIP